MTTCLNCYEEKVCNCPDTNAKYGYSHGGTVSLKIPPLNKEVKISKSEFFSGQPPSEEEFMNLTKKESEILYEKGREYTRSSSDRLANFKRLAEQLQLTKEQVWAVYFQKHIDSIMNYIQEGKTFSDESIEGRIMDARNYLYLFYLMVRENEILS